MNGTPGGGICLDTITNGAVVNCTIINNSAFTTGLGGGVVIPGSATTNVFFYNCIIVSNYASGNGTNIYKGNGPTNIYNCCSTNTYPGDLISTSAPYNNITVDPIFVDWINGNYRLTPDSPGIRDGTINNNAWLATTTDLDGRPRLGAGPFMPGVDMGAYQFLPTGTMVILR